jgi:ribosomal protein S18 acetylase RimI-like enzyme
MIKKLLNNDLETAEKIRSVFQASYKVEAKLLNARNFPPLKRPLEDYLKSTTEFFGYLTHEEIAGVIEIDHDNSTTHIRSLVVDPLLFRQGIAKKLMDFVLDRFDSNLFAVETGLDNEPATKLYEKFGFAAVNQWDTSDGIRKIKFEKRVDNQAR